MRVSPHDLSTTAQRGRRSIRPEGRKKARKKKGGGKHLNITIQRCSVSDTENDDRMRGKEKACARLESGQANLKETDESMTTHDPVTDDGMKLQ